MSKRHHVPNLFAISSSAQKEPLKMDNCDAGGGDQAVKSSSTCCGWKENRFPCESPQSPGSGSLKRPRAMALKRFDFSRIKDLSPSSLSIQSPDRDAIESNGERNPSQNSSRSTSSSSSPVPCRPLSPSSPVPESFASLVAAPSKILPFLYLGSQRDALSEEFITENSITHVLNVSVNCVRSPFVSGENFLRIPVNDDHSERMLPHFEQAVQFLDGCCKSNGRVLVHCLAGISRSPTLVIAYIMSHLNLSQEEAYRYVKTRRSTISPNFNFLGQLLEFESQLQQLRHASLPPSSPSSSSSSSSSSPCPSKKSFGKVNGSQKISFVPKGPLSPTILHHLSVGPFSCACATGQSPTTPTTRLARLSFEKVGLLGEQERVLAAAVGVQCLSPSGDKDIVRLCSSSSARVKFPSADDGFSDSFAAATTPHSGVALPSVIFKSRNQAAAGASSPPTKRGTPPVRPSSIAVSSILFDVNFFDRDEAAFSLKKIPFSSPNSETRAIPTPPVCGGGGAPSNSEIGAKRKSSLEFSNGSSLIRRGAEEQIVSKSQSFDDLQAPNSVVVVAASSDVVPKIEFDASPEICADRSWRHGALEVRNSNASLSSVGSHGSLISGHGSLHGSHELIQVS